MATVILYGAEEEVLVNTVHQKVPIVKDKEIIHLS